MIQKVIRTNRNNPAVIEINEIMKGAGSHFPEGRNLLSGNKFPLGEE